jgi:hypothetical protein
MTNDWRVRCLTRRSRFRWPRGLRRGSAAARLLGLQLWIPPGSWVYFFCCECCVLSGSGLCDELITRPEDTYKVWCVCDHEASIMRMPWSISGVAPGKKENTGETRYYRSSARFPKIYIGFSFYKYKFLILINANTQQYFLPRKSE